MGQWERELRELGLLEIMGRTNDGYVWRYPFYIGCYCVLLSWVYLNGNHDTCICVRVNLNNERVCFVYVSRCMN